MERLYKRVRRRLPTFPPPRHMVSIGKTTTMFPPCFFPLHTTFKENPKSCIYTHVASDQLSSTALAFPHQTKKKLKKLHLLLSTMNVLRKLTPWHSKKNSIVYPGKDKKNQRKIFTFRRRTLSVEATEVLDNSLLTWISEEDLELIGRREHYLTTENGHTTPITGGGGGGVLPMLEVSHVTYTWGSDTSSPISSPPLFSHPPLLLHPHLFYFYYTHTDLFSN